MNSNSPKYGGLAGDFSRIYGYTENIGGTSVTVLDKDADNNLIKGKGATVPTDTQAGYAKGCQFIKTDGGVATTTYINEGSNTSCDFNAVESAASTVTGVTAGAGMTGGGTEGTVTLNVINTDGKITVGADTIDVTAGSLTRADLSAPAGSQSVRGGMATIATTGAETIYLFAPEAGSLASVDFTGVEALAANDTNYVTFTITNKGQDGSGTTVMLAATDANTTKATGGSALVAKGKRALTVTATTADLVVVKGDVLEVVVTASGTLANTVTLPAFVARFSGTT